MTGRFLSLAASFLVALAFLADARAEDRSPKRLPGSGEKAGNIAPKTPAEKGSVKAPPVKTADGKGEKKEAAQPKEKGSDFLRMTRDDKSLPQALETAVVTFSPQDCGKTSPTVDLVAAVHLGERSYYEELNRIFATYDVVLYELVAPEGTVVPKGGGKGSGHPISLLQNFMTDVLKLEYQLKGVDYTRKNFVHADLSPDEFSKAMEKRGESFLTMFFRAMGYAMSRQGQGGPSDAQLLFALLNKNRANALKCIMAEQFQDLGGSISSIEGPDGSAILTDRNKRALEVLRKQLDKGKKKIAIFYGAAHMPDFEKHLHDDFGLVPVNTRWLVAWDLKGSPSSPRAKAAGSAPAKP